MVRYCVNLRPLFISHSLVTTESNAQNTASLVRAAYVRIPYDPFANRWYTVQYMTLYFSYKRTV